MHFHAQEIGGRRRYYNSFGIAIELNAQANDDSPKTNRWYIDERPFGDHRMCYMVAADLMTKMDAGCRHRTDDTLSLYIIFTRQVHEIVGMLESQMCLRYVCWSTYCAWYEYLNSCFESINLANWSLIGSSNVECPMSIEWIHKPEPEKSTLVKYIRIL